MDDTKLIVDGVEMTSNEPVKVNFEELEKEDESSEDDEEEEDDDDDEELTIDDEDDEKEENPNLSPAIDTPRLLKFFFCVFK